MVVRVTLRFYAFCARGQGQSHVDRLRNCMQPQQWGNMPPSSTVNIHFETFCTVRGHCVSCFVLHGHPVDA